MKKSLDVFDKLLIFLNYRKKISYVLLVTVVSSIIISLFLPKWYESSARIFFPKSESGAGLNLSAIIGDLPIDLGSSGSIGFARMRTIISSRSFQDDVIRRFTLKNIYENDYLFETREELQKHYDVSLDFEDNSVRLAFEYEESMELAQEICEYMLTKADSIYRIIETKEATNKRIYIEKIYNEATSHISEVEDSLRIFQETNRTYHLDAQLEATIKNLAIIEQQRVETSLEFDYLKNIVNENGSLFQELELRMITIEENLKKAYEESEDYSVLLPLKGLPTKGMEYYKLKREIEILTKVLEFVVPQYENALIEEQQSKPSFVILDYPNLPEYKSRPKRALIVLAITMSVFIFLIIYIYIIESIKLLKISNPEKFQKLEQILLVFRIKLQ